MAKYHGMIGYIVPTEVRPGVWKELPVEKEAYGDFIEDRSNFQYGDKVNENITISGKLSIMASQYAVTNFQHIRYATYMGTVWSVKSVRPAYPRLHLTLGEMYNGRRPGDEEKD